MHFGFLVTRYVSSVLAIFLVLSADIVFVVVHNATQSSALRHEGMLAAYFGVYAIADFPVDMGWARAVLVERLFGVRTNALFSRLVQRT